MIATLERIVSCVMGFIQKLKIKYKIMFVLTMLSFMVIVLISGILAIQFQNALKERIFLQLSSVRNLKTAQIKHVFESYLHEVQTVAESIDNVSYLDALAADEFIHIDSVVLAEKSLHTDTFIIEDISSTQQDGKIHLVYYYPYNNLVYKFYSVPERIQEILFERTGLGETGETYIVGKDMFLRSVSRFFPDSIPSTIYSNSKNVKRALSGLQGSNIQLDYRGVEVLSSYQLFNYKGVEWIILSEIDKKEAFYPLRAMTRRILLFALIIFLLAILISYYISIWLVSPIILARNAITHISKGEKDHEIQWKAQDEIGDLFIAVNNLLLVNKHIIDFSNTISKGENAKDMELRSSSDELVIALNHMKNQLSYLKEQEQVLLKKNNRQFVEGEENERQRLSRELHDSIAPLLTSILLRIQRHYKGSEKVEEILKMVRDTIAEVRKVSFNLMPSVLNDFGLIEALNSFIKVNFSEGDFKVVFEHDCDGEHFIPKNIELNLFRIVQEALHNAVKHAKSKRIHLSISEFPDQINMFIKDDGCGFDVDNLQRGNGILNMKERVRMFDGHWSLISNSEGTTIEVEFKKDQA